MTILNQEKIQQLSNEIGSENIPMLIEIFIGELSDYAETLSNCPLSERGKQLGEISHALKSSAASFGADDLCALAIEVDKQVKEGNTVGGEPQNQNFIHLLKLTHNEYSALL